MRTHHGIRLWTVKQAPFLQGDPGTWDLDLGDISFTPKMAKRTTAGPFATAPIFQGDINAANIDDSLYCARGSQIGGNFYTTTDGSQGTISFWFTPEWNNADYSYEHIDGVFWTVNFTSGLSLVYQYDNNRFLFYFGGKYISRGYTFVAGTTYHIVLRWDINNTLDGTNYGCITVNESHGFGSSAQPNSITPGGGVYIGGESDTTNESINGIVEGFTIYRRPLFDGAYGIDVGNGDEINQIYNAGSGKDPCRVTGSWDVCFCLPTNSTVEEIVTGTGEAWSHPHSSNLLGNGGFMLDGTYTDDGWADEGTPTAVAALAAAEKIFPGGYKVTSDAANEGIYKDYTCTPDEDFVIRVLGHSDGTSVPEAILYDQTNTAEIGSLTGTNGSTRAVPDVFIFTGRAPAGCTTLRVKLINTDATASDITYWHQCELLANLLQAPSIEAGAGDPWIPTGWVNQGLDAGDTEAEAGVVHSGSGCIQFNAGAITGEAIRNPNTGVAVGKFCCVGSWSYGTGSAGVSITLEGNQWAYQSTLSGDYSFINTTAAWVHSAAVVRRQAVGGSTFFVYGREVGPCYVDDVYLILMDDVSLTATAANEANSTEGAGIRSDGLDIVTVDITGILGSKSGVLRFKWTPRHDAEKMKKFGSNNPYIAGIYFNASNRICLNYYNANDIELYINTAGNAASDLWDSTGAIIAGTTYLIEIEYNANNCTFKFDGIVKNISSPGAGIDFGDNIPHTVYLGQTSGATQFIDAVYSPP